MRNTSHISAVALAAALIALPSSVQAQPNLGVDLGAGTSGGLGLGVDVGIGDTDVGVDAEVGGDSVVDVDATVDTSSGSDGGSGGGSSGGLLDNDLVDVDLDLDGDDGGIGVDADLLDDTVEADVVLQPAPAATPAPQPAPSEPLLGVRVSALEDTARLDAVIDLFGQPNLAGTDLDAVIDDRQVSIVAVADLFGADSIAEIDAMIDAGGAGSDELLAAIDASVELGAILEREGVEPEAVVALYVGTGGDAEVLVLDAALDLAAGGNGDGDDGDSLDTDLAEIDLDLLSDDELAELDLALLPEEEQRLDAIVRILGNGSGEPNGGTVGSVEVVDLDLLLGEESLAELELVLGDGDDDLTLSADILDVLDDAGLSPEAVIGIGSGNGGTQVFVDADLGDTQVADVQLDLGGIIGSSDDDGDGDAGGGNTGGGNSGGGNSGGGNTGGGNTGGGNTGGGNTGGGNTGGGNTGGGNTGDGNTGGGNTGGGNTGGGDTGGGNTGGGDTGGGNTGGGNTGGGSTGGGNSGGGAAGGGLVNDNGTLTGSLPAAVIAVNSVVADVSCDAGLAALGGGEPVAPDAVDSVRTVELVRIEGCVQTLAQAELAALRQAIEDNAALSRSIEGAGLDLATLIGGNVEGTRLTLYFEGPEAVA